MTAFRSIRTPIENYVIDRVKEMRLAEGFSQKKIAEHLKVEPSFIGNIESPKRGEKYSLNHLNELSKLFDCSPRDFLPEKFI
ncbi:MAG: helix-turn-helix transcriptional regulator [Flavihumibacter sp.]